MLPPRFKDQKCNALTIPHIWYIVQAEDTGVLVLVSGIVEENEGKAFESPLFDIAVSNDDPFNPVQILGRRFGPFDGPVQDNFNFGNQFFSLLNSRLPAFEDFQSQIATAMALRCPRMRQHALQNILFNQYHNIIPQEGSSEPGVYGAAISTEEDTDAFSSSSSSSNGQWLPGITAKTDLTAEEPDYWNEIKENKINMQDDILIDFEMDGDSNDRLRDTPRELPLSFLPHYGHNHFSHEHAHREHRDHFHHDGHHGEERFRAGGGFKTKPLPFNRFNRNYDGRADHSNQPLPQPDIIFSATVYTDSFDEGFEGIEGVDLNGLSSAYRAVREGEEGDEMSEQFVNWQLWNKDGSLNIGFLIFIVLCVACAVVWSALLMQCASMGYDWATCCSRTTDGGPKGQFMVLAALSDSESDNEDEGELKGWQKKNNSVVIAADYTKC